MSLSIGARDFISVKDFGVKGDGVTDDTATIKAADAAAAVAGKSLVFPAGTYVVSSALTPSTSVRWIGESWTNTALRTNSATANILTITNPNVIIENFQFSASVARTGGWYVDVGASVFTLQNFLMNAPFEGIRIQDAISIVNIKDGTINNTVASTGNSIRIGSGTAAGPVAVLIRDIIASSSLSARPFSHVVIANAGDVTLVACQLIGGNTNINILPGSGQAVVRCI
jgi:hypothetical protein